MIDGQCKVFFFADTESRTEEWALAVIVGRKRIFEIIENNSGPFFATIGKFAWSHISALRYAGGGGPIEKPLTPQAIAAVAKSTEQQPAGKPQQSDLFDK